MKTVFALDTNFIPQHYRVSEKDFADQSSENFFVCIFFSLCVFLKKYSVVLRGLNCDSPIVSLQSPLLLTVCDLPLRCHISIPDQDPLIVLMNLVCVFDNAFLTSHIIQNMIVYIQRDIIIYRIAWLQEMKSSLPSHLKCWHSSSLGLREDSPIFPSLFIYLFIYWVRRQRTQIAIISYEHLLLLLFKVLFI